VPEDVICREEKVERPEEVDCVEDEQIRVPDGEREIEML
jgi:hypothetical protein